MRHLADERLRAGLGWIADHRDHCRPADLFDAPQLKELAELSILFGALGRWMPDAHRLGELRVLLLDLLAMPVVAEWVRKLPSAFSPYVIAYLPLRALGHRIVGFEEALVRLRRAGYPAALETVPYRELELKHMMWQAGLGSRPRCGATYRRTALARCRNPVYFSLDEVYSTTHTLIYLTDLCGPADNLPPEVRAHATAVIEALLLHFWRKPDWDVSAELLLNALALDLHDSALFRSAFAALLDAWTADGTLPGPGAASLAGDADARARFDAYYHTTLVGVLLCGAYLHRTDPI